MRSIVIHFAFTCFVTIYFGLLSTVVAEDLDDRIASGKRFLNDTRLDQWEAFLTVGIQDLGQIRIKMAGKVLTEAWFERENALYRRFEPKNRVTTIISNAKYLAEIRTRNGESRIHGIYPAVPPNYTNIHALPFTIGSSPNFAKELIPTNMRNGKLEVIDYRFENRKHIIELKHVEDADKGTIELVFDGDSPSLLPEETITAKGTPYPRHFVYSNFQEVAGYHIPLQVREKGRNELVITEIFPEDRLDTEKCWLTYYGLPEPGELTVADFGPKPIAWFNILLIAMIVVIVATVGYYLVRRRNAYGS